MENNKILTVEDVADILKVTERTVRRLLKNQTIKGYKKLNKWYILYDDLVTYIKSDN